MRSRVCNEGKVGSPRGAGRIICLPGICVSSSGADARKMALEIAVKGDSPAATTYSEDAECDEMHRRS